MISDGAEILVSSSILGVLKDRWGLTSMVRGMMMSVIFLGVFAGSLIGGQLGDRLGRRRAVLSSYSGIVIFGACNAAAQGPISMLILRFFFGASFGVGLPPGMALQVETSPSSWRGHIINLGGLWFTLGEVYTAVLLIIFMPELTDPDGTSWRLVSLLSVVPGLLLLPFAWLLLQESPHYLLSNNMQSEAVLSVQYIAHMNNQAEKVEGLSAESTVPQLILPEIVEGATQGSSSSSSRDSSGGEELQPVPVKTLSQTFELLFGKVYRSIIIGGAYLCFLSNFLFYGLTYALPIIFKTLGSEISPALQVLVISLCDLPGVLLGFFLIYSKNISHRTGLTILAATASVLALALISMDHGDKYLYVGLPAAYLAKFVAAAFFTLSYVYLTEIFPSSVRATGLALCVSMGRMGSIFSPLIFELLHEKALEIGSHAPFMILTSVLSLLGIVVIKFSLYFELKNAPLQQRRTSKLSLPGIENLHASKEGEKTPLHLSGPAPAG